MVTYTPQFKHKNNQNASTDLMAIVAEKPVSEVSDKVRLLSYRDSS